MNSTMMNASDTRATATLPGNRVRLSRSSMVSVWRAVHRAPAVAFPMDTVRELAAGGEIGKALDLVFDELDGLLLGERFDECSAVLRVVEPTQLPAVVAVGFLAITRAADAQLHDARAALRQRIETAYQPTMRADDLEQLLRGL